MSKAAGITAFLAVWVLGAVWSGTAAAFVDLPSLVLVAGSTAALFFIGYGKGMSRNEVYSRLKRYSMYSGWLTVIIGMISYFSTIEDKFNFAAISVCLTGLLYSYIFSFILDCFIKEEKAS
jgi:hypothetical protein